MAIITISRKIASYGDETAQALANIMGFKFVDKKILSEGLQSRGISADSLKKYDERKPGFWASLSRERDEYFDFLRELIYEYAQEGNTIFIGRGSTILFKDVPGCYRVRLIASDEVRVQRLMKEFDWEESQAAALMEESDTNRDGFHRCFFNAPPQTASQYHMILNTDAIAPQNAAQIIKSGMENTISDEEITQGKKRIREILLAQQIVNYLAFTLKLPIYFLDTEVSDTQVVLHGVADSAACINEAVAAASDMAEGKKVSSSISVAHEYRSFHQGNYIGNI